MTLILLFIWRWPKLIYRSILKSIICHPKLLQRILISWFLQQHPFLLLHCHQLQNHLKKFSLSDSNAGTLLPMNWLNFGTYHRKILTLAIPFNGGMAVVLNSHSSTALFMIFSQSQVIISSTSFLTKLIYHLSSGSVVAVEQIFSGGWDTISLRCASLKPETIRILMLVKRKLIISWENIATKLCQPSKLHMRLLFCYLVLSYTVHMAV